MPGGPPPPVGQIGDPAERVRGRLRERERRDRPACRRRPAARRARPLPEEARHDRLAARRLGRARRSRAATSSARVTSGGTKIASTASIDVVGERDAAARPRTGRRSRRRRGRPDCAPTRPTSAIAAQRVLGRGVELGHLEAGARARVGGEDAGPAGVADDRDAAAGRERLVREHHRGRQQLVERVDADHAGLAEQRVDRDVGRRRARRCATTRRGSRPRCGRSSPRRSASSARRCARAARTCAGSRTTRGTAGSPRSARRRPSTAAGRCR